MTFVTSSSDFAAFCDLLQELCLRMALDDLQYFLFWVYDVSRLRPHGSVGSSGCLPLLFHLLDVDGIPGGRLGVIYACLFSKWALGRDT